MHGPIALPSDVPSPPKRKLRLLRTKPLVVLAHPPVLREPREEGAFHHPAPRQYHQPSWRHGAISFCQSTFSLPSLAHSSVPTYELLLPEIGLGGGGRTADDLDTHAQDLLNPTACPGPPSLPPATDASALRLLRWALSAAESSSSSFKPSSGREPSRSVCTLALRTKPSVSTKR